MRRFNPQLGPQGELRHFLTTEGLSRVQLEGLLGSAARMAGAQVPASLQGRTIGLSGLDATLEGIMARAVRRLGGGLWVGADPLARPADAHVLAHKASGAAHGLARGQPHVINAGDGWHARPLPALADLLHIRQAKGGFTELRIALLGDLRHDGRGRCLVHALTTLGAPQLRLATARALRPDGLAQLGLSAHDDTAQALEQADVVIDLGLQPDALAVLPSARDYARRWGLTPAARACAQPDALFLGDTPAAGVETAAMAVLHTLLGARP